MNYLTIFVVSVLISAISTLFVIKLAKKYGFMDYPGRAPPANIITTPTPRAGGIPILISLLVLVPLFVSASGVMETPRIISFLLASTLLVVLGTLDDKYDLNPYLRFGINLLSALLIVGSGIAINWLPNPFGGEIRFDQLVWQFGLFGKSYSIPILADLLTLVWLTWMMNAINWSKGVDGQLPGIVTIASLILSFVALKYVEVDPTQTSVAILAFIVSGAYFGFLPFNFYPQRIMPGYGGGALAGLLLGVLAILAGGRLATTLLVLIVPLADALFAIVRRLMKGKSPFWGDRGHLHHKLLDLGWSKAQVALFYWLLTAVSGWAALNLGSKGKSVALASVGVIIISILTTLYFTISPNKKDN
ncbi:MAG: hypothetical protein A3F33_00275 [Candidatus Woykebacteria bacterium RIFCSPHIGHO2_12_FULL_43_10]|nr:MAG: hypothetical protein A3F33_00275 [Candidatus Woykebacteria bacterium RIFCSPHIGHO2_12_FULL_43_10]